MRRCERQSYISLANVLSIYSCIENPQPGRAVQAWIMVLALWGMFINCDFDIIDNCYIHCILNAVSLPYYCRWLTNYKTYFLFFLCFVWPLLNTTNFGCRPSYSCCWRTWPVPFPFVSHLCWPHYCAEYMKTKNDCKYYTVMPLFAILVVANMVSLRADHSVRSRLKRTMYWIATIPHRIMFNI